MIKNSFVLATFLLLAITQNASAIESNASYLRCFSVNESALVLQYEGSSDNIAASDSSVSLKMYFYPLQHSFQGKQLPSSAKVDIRTDGDDKITGISASYSGKDGLVSLVVDSSKIKQDSYDGTSGNDISTATFPGTISVKITTPGNENSYQEEVRCRTEVTSHGMAG